MRTMNSETNCDTSIMTDYSSLRSEVQKVEWQKLPLLAQVDLTTKIIRKLPDRFHEALKMLMYVLSVSVARLSELMPMSERTIYRYLSGEVETRDPDRIAMFCVALHLPSALSSALLETAGISLRSKVEEDVMLRAVLESMYRTSVDCVRKELIKANYPRISKWPVEIIDEPSVV